MRFCSGSNSYIDESQHDLNIVNLYTCIAFTVLCAIATVAASIYIFCKRRGDQRPLFVTKQMVILNCFWISFMVYYVILVGQKGDNISTQSQVDNIFASLGDLFFILHDWIFTQQYLSASLLMPIAITMIDGESDTEKQKVRAKRIVVTLQVIFYTMTLAWFILSVLSGSLIIRFSINIVFIFLTLVFLVSLYRIKSLIQKVNNVKHFETNHRLLNLNLVTFIVEGFTYGTVFILSAF